MIAPSDPGCVPRGRRGEEAAETPWSAGEAAFAASSPVGFVAFVGVVSLGEEAGEIVSPSEWAEPPASSPLPCP